MNDAQEQYLATRRRVMAAMETGNIDKARTEIIEYAETNPLEATSLRGEVAQAYGTGL